MYKITTVCRSFLHTVVILCGSRSWNHSGNKVVFAEHLLDFCQGIFHLFLGVGCHQREADESVLRGYCGGYHWIDEQAFVEEVAYHMVCLLYTSDAADEL